MLAKIDRVSLSFEGRERLEYHAGLERFAVAFYEAHTTLETAQRLLQSGDVKQARASMEKAQPERAIAEYVRAAKRGAITRGEEALVISLNLRWLPYFTSLRQATGIEPAGIKFGPTQHEPLAQSAGSNTFFFDVSGALWKTLGEKETGFPAFAAAHKTEICSSGITVDKPLTLKLAGIMGDPLPPGKYRADWIVDHESRMFSISEAAEITLKVKQPVRVCAVDIRAQ
jgi:hypothetical protein